MRVVISIGLVATILGLATREARACGGCFVPQPAMLGDASTSQSGTVVTDHRMALAITSQGTTLWDQIEYAGDPAEFAWVLPIAGPVAVGVGSDAFIQALDDKTAPRITAPQVYCNPPPGSGSSSRGMDCACGSSSSDSATAFSGGAADGGAEDSGVVVTHRDVVGPYDTVQLTGTGSDSILSWLRTNGFDVPASIAPVVQKYVDEKFAFLAVRLRPGSSVNAMKPIRVSWRGKMPMLPLRMVAAGVASSVGLKLFVIGDGRWRTANFPSFTIDANELTWDFAAARSTYGAVRDQKAAATDGRGWALEASVDMAATELPAAAVDLSADAGAVDDAAPPIPASARDVDVAFYADARTTRRVTRLRANLPVRHLTVDLQLEADLDQSARRPDLHPATYVHAEKLCPYGIAYSSPASLMGATAGTASCAVTEERSPISASLAGLGALAVLGLARRAVRRRSG